MKITDFALIFVGITLPIIIIVYVNVSFTIKAQEQEMYYNKIIQSALEDATSQMKEVENTDAEIDYGYSGVQNSKVSVNPEIAKNAFLNSLYNNFGIRGNDAAEQYLQTFIPCIAIIDYNGVYISSEEEYTKGGQTVIEHVVKPKKYYSYTYTIGNDGKPKDGIDTTGDVHTVEFTMDDYITHRSKNSGVTSFYISDSENNSVLDDSYGGASDEIVKHLQEKRKQVIIDTITKEIANATNKATSYAKAAGIDYSFVFPTITQDDMNNAIENVGMFAFVQGINIGNKYLNARAYATTKLEESTKYYFSVFNDDSKYKLNLYHKDINCPEYQLADHNGVDDVTITPTYVLTKQQATSARITYSNEINSIKSEPREGFYPCPICKP